MNRILSQFLVLLILLSFGCTIQKRQFRSGWHISYKQQLSSSGTQKKKAEQAFTLDSLKVKYKNHDLTEKPFSVEELIIEKSEVVENKAFANEKDTPKKIDRKNKKVLHNSIKKNYSFRESKIEESFDRATEEEYEYKGPLFPRILGGFFGVLLALLALIPLLFIVFFIIDESISSLTFKVKESDNYFVTAFKNCYHAVFRAGLLIFITILVFCVAALIVLAGYNLLGVFGLILAIILAILIILLFALIWRWLLDFLMFKE